MKIGQLLLILAATFWGAVGELAAQDASAPTVLNFCERETFDSLVAYLPDGAEKADVFRLNDDGVIEVSGEKIGYLATPNDYRNFTLRGEYSFQDAETNGGLLVRILAETPTFLPKCVEIQIMPGLTGDLFGFHDLEINGAEERFETGKNHEMVGNFCWVHALRKGERSGLGEWNVFEATCFEDWILVRVNGQIVNWAFGVPQTPAPVAIQSETARIHWRNLQLTVER